MDAPREPGAEGCPGAARFPRPPLHAGGAGARPAGPRARADSGQRESPAGLRVRSRPTGGSAARARRCDGRGCGARAEFWGLFGKKVRGGLGVGAGLQRLAGGGRAAGEARWGVAASLGGGGGEGGARGGEAQPPEGVSDGRASVNASECVRAGAGGVPRGAGVSLQPGSSLRPPCPARRALLPAPLAPPWRARRWDAPAEQAVAAASWGALGSALPEGPEPSRPRSARPRRPRFPPGHALSNFVAAAAASGAAGRAGGGRGAEPGRAGRGRRGARRAVAPARGPTMPQLGGGGSGAGAAGGGDDLGANDELIPFQDEGGEEQEPSSDSASAQRDLDEVKSSLVNESENQSSSSDSEVRRLRRPTPRTPARRPLTRPRLCVSSAGGEAPAALSGRLPEAAGLFRRRYVLVPAAPVPGPRCARSLRWGRPASPLPAPSWGRA